MEQQRKIEIDIVDLFHHLKKKLVFVLVFALVCGIAGFVVFSFFVTPEYVAETRMFVMNRTNESHVGSADFQISNYMIKDYTVLITGQNVTKEVISRLGLNMTPGMLKQKIRISAPDNTRVLQINVVDEDPQRAADIANTIYEVAAQQLQSIMDVDVVNLVYAAEVPQFPTSPNVRKGTLNAAAVGCLLALVVFVVIYVVNDTIRTEEDVEHYLGLSVLGAIPKSNDMEEGSKEKTKRINLTKIMK